MAVNKEKELLAQYIFTIFADNGVSIYMGFADKLADGLIARGYGRIDKFADKLKAELGEDESGNGLVVFFEERRAIKKAIDRLLEEYKNESN